MLGEYKLLNWQLTAATAALVERQTSNIKPQCPVDRTSPNTSGDLLTSAAFGLLVTLEAELALAAEVAAGVDTLTVGAAHLWTLLALIDVCGWGEVDCLTLTSLCGCSLLGLSHTCINV